MTDRMITFTIYTGFAAVVLAMLILAGICLDGIGRYSRERDLCLKRATNGYENERCR